MASNIALVQMLQLIQRHGDEAIEIIRSNDRFGDFTYVFLCVRLP